MFVLGGSWRDGYLDYHRAPGELRIAVGAWCIVERLTDVFLDQPRSIRRVWHYIREVGVRQTLRKIRSRWAERVRDRRVLAVGVGRVVEADEGAAVGVGAGVVFVAPCHPECVERVTLPAALVRPADEGVVGRLGRRGAVQFFESVDTAGLPDTDELAGWSRFSGRPVPPSAGAVLEWAVQMLGRLDAAAGRPLETPGTAVAERSGPAPQRTRGSAVLFGLGNYAKTCILPNLDPRIDVKSIHEIEPTQLPVAAGRSAAGRVFDTCESPRPDEDYDVYFIAGYHHTHVPLAVHALRRGCWAVSEKPLVTTRAELDELLSAMGAHPGRYFACFHMRYNPLFELARQDLGVRPGHPIHYHAIIFEVPLVRRHWYHWPVSKSRIVSNGCHWLDHFLHMNEFAPVRRCQIFVGGNGDAHASVELENDATLSLVLTDVGSRRVGVQEHIQMRAGGTTVRVDNSSRYMSEERFRIIRRTRFNKLDTFGKMYSTISTKIMSGQAGDSLESTQRSCELMLTLEEMYQAAAKK